MTLGRQKHEKVARFVRILNVFEDWESMKCEAICIIQRQNTF